ncbi:ABC transporter permease [Candidatus Epulonipiscium fishelsonii]|uniref:ABC transporter permease n=1 Tax=Candidatus Epulonipiscium fishelsonii TaxID=77094 RepID=A0ACC8XIN0_9FIRM|nr:ABC transporter permease [Epulopiscium sp. SCG-D08WGA-EpuloA1]
MSKNRNLKWIYLFLAPSLIIFAMFYLVPIVTLFSTSLTKWDGFNAPAFIGLDNYIKLFTQDSFLISLKNLVYWGIIAGTLHVGFAVVIAFLLHKKPFGWKFVRSVYMIPNIISVAAWAMIYRFFFNNEFGVLNNLIRKINPDFNVNWFFESPFAFWAITLTWLFYGVIVTLIVFNELMSISPDIHEAAKIDGANERQITTKINLPLCKNAIATGIILSITSRIAMYETIALTTRGGPGDDTMNIPIILVNAINDMNYGYANASAVMMFLFGIMVLVIINKLFGINKEQ